MLPLIPSTPTDWSTLYTALKLVQGVNVAVSGSNRTIVTLDLQTYSKCVQMRERNDIKDNFIFRLGELHISFAMLKVVGKYIDESGLDNVFQQAGVFSKATLNQIMDGGNYKRGVETYTTIYLALKSLHMKEAKKNVSNWNQFVKDIKDTVKISHPHS